MGGIGDHNARRSSQRRKKVHPNAPTFPRSSSRSSRRSLYFLIALPCLSSHLITSHHITSHLITSHLITSHLITSHLISSLLFSIFSSLLDAQEDSTAIGAKINPSPKLPFSSVVVALVLLSLSFPHAASTRSTSLSLSRGPSLCASRQRPLPPHTHSRRLCRLSLLSSLVSRLCRCAARGNEPKTRRKQRKKMQEEDVNKRDPNVGHTQGERRLTDGPR